MCRQSAGDSETFWTDEEVVVACVEGFTFHTVGQGLAKGAACGLAVNQKFSKSQVSDVDKLLFKFSDVFEGQGLLKGTPAKLELIEGATPKRAKPYRVPIALQSAVDKELDRLVSAGVLVPVQHSDWATSLLFVPKSDGSIRPCGD